jgi:hypothetical protein
LLGNTQFESSIFACAIQACSLVSSYKQFPFGCLLYESIVIENQENDLI